MKLRTAFLIQFLLFVQLFTGLFTAFAQGKKTQKREAADSTKTIPFRVQTAKANVKFVRPAGFKTIPAINNEDFTFDYAMLLPHDNFEVWYQVRSQKENWASYERNKYNENAQLANPDSVYKDVAKAHAMALSGEQDLFVKVLPQTVLSRYNADAGQSYMLTLQDTPETKHYQYALLLALQKFHTGTVLMLCFTNQKTPEFYKNVERAGKSFRFNNGPRYVNKLKD